jgi:hypothetical protein
MACYAYFKNCLINAEHAGNGFDSLGDIETHMVVERLQKGELP